MTESTAAAGLRTTRQRTAVAGVLERVDGFRSAQDLHDLLRHDGIAVGLTTVYRHLQALSDAGVIDVLRTDDGEAVYRRCPTATHHHHLVCRDCGRSVEVEGPEVETWATAVTAEHGFTDVSHTVEVFRAVRELRPQGAASQLKRCVTVRPAVAAGRRRPRQLRIVYE